MVKAFYRALAAAHGLADLGIRHVLDEFQDQQVLALRRQVADEFQKRIPLLALHQRHFGRLALVMEGRSIVESGISWWRLRSRCQLAIRLWAIRYNQAENGTPRSV